MLFWCIKHLKDRQEVRFKLSKVVRSTLRLNDKLDFKIKLIAKRNNMSENAMKEYLLELGIQTYLKKYDKLFDYDDTDDVMEEYDEEDY